MTTSLKFTIETQTERGEVISLCHLNEKVIALEISDVAKKMFKLNRSLFDKINASTKLLGGKVYRNEVTMAKKDKNRCAVEVFDKYDYKEVEIMNLSFSNNQMLKRQSILLKTGRRVDFNPTHVGRGENIGGMPQVFDDQNLTHDDIKNSTMVCEMSELQFLQGEGVRTYLIKDFLRDSPGIKKVSYRMQITAETMFEDYVNFVLSEMKQVISFLLSYGKTTNISTNYDSVKLEFKKSFTKSILEQLGLSNDVDSIDLGTDRIKNSQFGKAALSYYNASVLIRPDTQKDVYGEILKGLLPTSKTSPENISIIIKSFESLYNRLIIEYKKLNKDSKSSYFTSKISSKKNTISKFTSSKTEIIELDDEVLGYNVFSEDQKGINNFTYNSYMQRIATERLMYYPSINVSDGSNFLSNNEQAAFANIGNMSAFVTPTNLVMRDKEITCSRGLNNIPIDDIRLFRVAKAAKFNRFKKANLSSGVLNNGLSINIMAEFNIAIGAPKAPIFERPVEQAIDPLVDSKLYVGDNSFFVTDNPTSIYKNYKRLVTKTNGQILAVISDIIPATFLTKNGSLTSIADLQLANNKSKLRNLVAEKNINLNEIPPQIKAMVSKGFQNNPNIDPLKNSESRAIINETQMNLFVVRAQTGFELDENGFPDLNMPIIQDMNEVVLAGQSVIAKAHNYEIPELGVVKDNLMPTIYNNLVYIQG